MLDFTFSFLKLSQLQGPNERQGGKEGEREMGVGREKKREKEGMCVFVCVLSDSFYVQIHRT